MILYILIKYKYEEWEERKKETMQQHIHKKNTHTKTQIEMKESSN